MIGSTNLRYHLLQSFILYDDERINLRTTIEHTSSNYLICIFLFSFFFQLFDCCWWERSEEVEDSVTCPSNCEVHPSLCPNLFFFLPVAGSGGHLYSHWKKERSQKLDIEILEMAFIYGVSFLSSLSHPPSRYTDMVHFIRFLLLLPKEIYSKRCVKIFFYLRSKIKPFPSSYHNPPPLLPKNISNILIPGEKRTTLGWSSL